MKKYNLLKVLILLVFFTFLHTKISFADILGGNRTHLSGIIPAWEHPSVSLKNYTELFGYARSYWTNNGSKLYGFSLYSNTTSTSNIDEHYVEATRGSLNSWDCQQNKIYQYDKDELIRKWGKK